MHCSRYIALFSVRQRAVHAALHMLTSVYVHLHAAVLLQTVCYVSV
jgi:hypothetical protein